MTTRAFFSFALLLPLLGGLVGFLVPGLGIFAMSLVFGGGPYLLVAVPLVFLVRSASTKRRIVTLSLVSPLIFVALVVGFVAVLGSTPATRELTLREDADQLLPIAIYGLGFAYFYVACAWGLWLLARKVGLINDEFAAT